MSRHIAHLEHRGRKVTVVAGYDRPLRELFLQVLYADLPPWEDEQFLYASLDDPAHDWTDINTVADRLEALGIAVPVGMIESIFLDQCRNIGNLVVEHHGDQPPTVLAAG
ncbi:MULTISPECIES: hypothetical protein [Comamonadaceae]|jgi:hypothetical protein|nr:MULTISPECIES: hypothetical protein [Comamonadaceae]OJX31501.1 MAG: hypothetical protein BGO74_06105 [Burkholderiales bacterium 68-12]GAO20866.1 hypothetical protein ALISP_0686 [Alicycliphilus sp. B1]MDR7092882.1 hypothetical protein [Hydrogenophaga laconesensis]NCU65543.1 hypothetical protein [Acidovorax sp. 210-6]POR09653.1 hypothetical protein BV908_14255 [Diaphorobacter sp. LR2014-1]